jgi:hypothetical protein
VTHSPEPWHRGEEHESMCQLWDANNKIIGVIRQQYGIAFPEYPEPEQANGNAERVLACVNALAGIPTELLQNLPPPPENWNLSSLAAARYNLRTILARTEELLP